MNKKTTEIEGILPEIDLWELRSEADYYGASYIISSSIGFDYTPRSISCWPHGWKYLPLKYKNQLVIEKTECALVANQNHMDFLSKFNVNSHAVGMPFAYANKLDGSKVERIRNSLLVVPPHTLPYIDQCFNEELYVEEILQLKQDFDLVVVCVHSACYEKKMWVESFAKKGIPCIIGANVYDKNSLIRMNRIFKSFEYVTTNTIGSHVLYASLCGSKVSMYGTFANVDKKDYSTEPYYRLNPEILDYNMAGHTYENLSLLYPELFCHPLKAMDRVEWAKNEIGYHEIKSSMDVASLLGWFK